MNHHPPKQLTYRHNNRASLSFAILPLEPTEGVERLKHMIRDTRPYMVLTASSKDRSRLDEIVADVAAEHAGKPFAPFLAPRMVDLVDHVRDVLKSDSFANDVVMKKKNLDSMLGLSAPESLGFLCGGHHSSKTGEPYPNTISHIVYTSGTTGVPKGCVSSTHVLNHYLNMKNNVHGISSSSTVLLASSLSFDPCLSDILATFSCYATLALAPRQVLNSSLLGPTLRSLRVTHILCTPTLWGAHMAIEDVGATNRLPHLQVVALGGEPIPRRVQRIWARHRDTKSGSKESNGPRLLATYGVTEACVYQTAGEIFREEDDGSTKSPGQDVGLPFPGLGIRVDRENEESFSLVDVHEKSGVGEVILHGQQLDDISSYLNQKTLSQQKYIRHNGNVHYRTGDRGYIDRKSGKLYILGRIQGETGMVKINGVRVELGEIEQSLIDTESDAVVVDSMALVENDCCDSITCTVVKLVAYVVLCHQCLREMSLEESIPPNGVVCAGPLLILLRQRCRRSCRVIPNTFVILPRIPLSPTGKRDQKGSPLVSTAVSLESLLVHGSASTSKTGAILLKEYGKCGALVAEQIVDCLNLHVSQQSSMLTTQATFDMLGGDSLAATRVVRALYSRFYGIDNSRLLGGAHGILDDGRFSAVHLIRATNLGSYVDFLDSQTGGVFGGGADKCLHNENEDTNNTDAGNALTAEQRNDVIQGWNENAHVILDEALLEASTCGHARIASALLEVGADPNIGVADSRKFRLGKTSSRVERKQVFASSPLHHACFRGCPDLVRALLCKGAKTNSPDASGAFPLHLAASGGGRGMATTISGLDDAHAEDIAVDKEGSSNGDDEDCYNRRWECVRLLLDEAHLPLTMRDGNQHTIFHSAARAGQDLVLRRIVQRLKDEEQNRQEQQKQKQHGSSTSSSSNSVLNWRDRWSRTAVHWAVLNGHLSSLRILLEAGCLADPPMPNRSKSTSAALERPLDLCERLYDTAEDCCSNGKNREMGMAMKRLLQEYITTTDEI